MKNVRYEDACARQFSPAWNFMSTTIIPLPAADFDPTEAAVTWKLLTDNKINVTFSTPEGLPSLGDERILTGRGLGIWSPLLKADHRGRGAYDEMIRSQAFKRPIRWDEIEAKQFEALVLPGGHAPGMKPYLESKILQKLVSEFFGESKIVGAICHGVVLAARSQDQYERSVLSGRRVTALLQSQELTAWGLTRLWLGNYYRTYLETVQSEVTRALGDTGKFLTGPTPFLRDSKEHLERGFVVEDGNFISARWPGDAHLFGTTIVRRILK